MPHVVVVGAGFGGVSATDELAKEGFRVTLLDQFPYNTFQPLLYQVATGGLNPGRRHVLAALLRGPSTTMCGSAARRSSVLIMISVR